MLFWLSRLNCERETEPTWIKLIIQKVTSKCTRKSKFNIHVGCKRCMEQMYWLHVANSTLERSEEHERVRNATLTMGGHATARTSNVFATFREKCGIRECSILARSNTAVPSWKGRYNLCTALDYEERACNLWSTSSWGHASAFGLLATDSSILPIVKAQLHTLYGDYCPRIVYVKTLKNKFKMCHGDDLGCFAFKFVQTVSKLSLAFATVHILSKMSTTHNLPESLNCPILQCPFESSGEMVPVILTCGHTISRSALESILRTERCASRPQFTCLKK